jgi:hypothetical protein
MTPSQPKQVLAVGADNGISTVFEQRSKNIRIVTLLLGFRVDLMR